MFSRKAQTAKLINVNVRTELHGDEHKLATDLTVEIKDSNDVLSEFDPSLKSAFYRKPDESDGGQTDLLASEPGHLPKLRFPLIGPVKYGYVGSGYETVVHYGVSGKDDILLIDTQIDGFRFGCQDGGTVVTKFRIIAHPKTDDIGRLAEMIQQEITLTLTPPTQEELLRRELAEQEEE